MKAPRFREGIRRFGVNLAAVIVAALLFAGAFPNPLIEKGVPLFGWLTYIPLFWVIRRSSYGACAGWGFLYGFISYGIFNYWLSAFHPLAGLIVTSLACLYLVLFSVLGRLICTLFPRNGYIVHWLSWIALQYLHSQGFLGYPYGIIGYSQWTVLPVIQIADLMGVWGVSALVVFPQMYAAAALARAEPGQKVPLGETLRRFLRREWLAGGVWLLAALAALGYGLFSPEDYADAPSARIALVQHNTDPWKPAKAPTVKQSFLEYQKDLRILKRLSSEALAADPKPDLVVWPETAFVPRIYWHTTYRDDPDSYLLIRELVEFLRGQDAPFVFGNDDARLELNENGVWERVDYNAVFLYEQGELAQWYRKQHLVPFTEHFPYKKQFPQIYEALEKADTHFWKKGTEPTVFQSSGGLKFSTPICFEDIFGYLSRDFVRNGAELIVNLSNDAWSKSLSAQNQHLSMAVFRAVENRRSMVRSTVSGQTCGIDPNGKVLAMARPFTEAQLTVSVPIVTRRTLYTEYGDYLPRIFCGAVLVLLIAAGGLRIIRKIYNKRKEP